MAKTRRKRLPEHVPQGDEQGRWELRDIASAADVVIGSVHKWRRDSPEPMPAPLPGHRRPLKYDPWEVIAWLQETRRLDEHYRPVRRQAGRPQDPHPHMWRIDDIAEAAGVTRDAVVGWRNAYLSVQRGNPIPQGRTTRSVLLAPDIEGGKGSPPRWEPERVREWLRQTGRIDIDADDYPIRG